MAASAYADLPTLEQARAALDYDPLTGHFTWRHRADVPHRWNSRHAGKRAGCLYSGYNAITIHNRHFRAHQLAWLLIYGAWPGRQIDHINLCRLDNRIANLRLASPEQNGWNTAVKSSNRSGAKGVSKCSRTAKWVAQIRIGDGKRVTVGRYDTVAEAADAYAQAATKAHGEYARHG